MTKQTVGIIALGTSVVLIVGGVVAWQLLQPSASYVAPAPTTQATSETSDTSGQTLQAISSSGVPLGGLEAQPSANQNQAQGTTSNAAPANAASVNPATFAQYDVHKTDQSALFADITVGSGAVVSPNQTLSVNYQGWLTNGALFDQNITSNKPFSFVFGSGQVIPGWEQGISGMKVGGERLIVVPPAVGYGAQGQGSIPPNAVLVFYVKVLAAQ